MISLIRANCGFLQQGIDLLEMHDNDTYVGIDPKSFGSSIGAHLRHVLDHYSSFLKGVDEGLVDYDDRKRKTSVETDRVVAIKTIREIIDQLTGLEEMENHSVDVVVSANAKGASEKSSSSLRRELQFLASHTVHHYALIAIASRMQGVPPAKTFGVAPSTLKYLEAASG